MSSSCDHCGAITLRDTSAVVWCNDCVRAEADTLKALCLREIDSRDIDAIIRTGTDMACSYPENQKKLRAIPKRGAVMAAPVMSDIACPNRTCGKANSIGDRYCWWCQGSLATKA